MKHIIFSFLIAMFLSLSGCFEVIEEVNLQEDGSGDFKLTLNLSKSKERVKGILAQDTLRGKKVPSIHEISNEIDQLVKDLQSINGITDVVASKNFEDFIISINYHFKDVKTLNSSIQYLIAMRVKNKPELSNDVFFSYKDSVFERKMESDYSALVKGFYGEALLKTSIYVSIYRFEKSIDEVSNLSTKISKSGKAVINVVDASQLIKDQTLIQNKINLK